MKAEKAFALVSDLTPDDPANLMRLEIALDHIEDIMRLDRKLDDCNKRIITQVKASGTTLTRVYGIGPINAGMILGEVGDSTRSAKTPPAASTTAANSLKARATKKHSEP